jgi:hypothetical protein
MFCMACGAEIANHLSACPNCGKPVTNRLQGDDTDPASSSPAHPGAPPPQAAFSAATFAASTPSSPALAALPTSPASTVFTPPAAVPAPSISDGDLGASLLPRDTLGRVILATTIAMAADVLAPWVVVGGQQHVALAHIGSAVLVLLAALVVPIVAVRPPLRKQPLWAAAPMVLGSIFLGGGVGVMVLLSWLASRVQLIGSDPSLANIPGGTSISSTPTVVAVPAYAADIGLYLFLVGSVILMVAGYQLFMSAREGRPQVVLLSTTGRPAAYTAYPVAWAGTALAASPASAAAPASTVVPPGTVTSLPVARSNGTAPAPDPATVPTTPVAESLPSGPVLPGTAAWNQPQIGPTAIRTPSLGNGLQRPLGPRRGR